MNPPEIPGFYYDPERKKYFKIVNGDQRHNSNYSNSQIRASERRKQYEKSSESILKRAKLSTEASTFGISSLKIHHCTEFSNRILQMKLGAFQLPPQTAIFQSTPKKSFERLTNHALWHGLNDSTVFATHGTSLELHESKQILGTVAEPIPLAMLSIPTSFHDSNYEGTPKALELVVSGNYVFLRYGNTFSLLKWIILNRSHRVEDLSVTVLRLLQNHFLPEDPETFHNFWNGGFQNGLLHLVSEGGFCAIIDLNQLKVVDGGRFNPFWRTPIQIERNFNICNGMKSFKLALTLFFCSNTQKPFRKWNLKSTILRFFTEPVDVVHSNGTKDGYVRFYVFVRDKLVIRQYSSPQLRQIGTDVIIHIFNDNEARPLISKMGEALIIEESKNTFKIIELGNYTTRVIKIGQNPTNGRDGCPRLLTVKDKIVWSDNSSSEILVYDQ